MPAKQSLCLKSRIFGEILAPVKYVKTPLPSDFGCTLCPFKFCKRLPDEEGIGCFTLIVVLLLYVH